MSQFSLKGKMTHSRLTTYYNNGRIPLRKAADLPYTDVNLAFIFTTPEAPLTLQLGGAIAATPTMLTNNTKAAIAMLQNNKQKVMISFGGGTIGSATYQQIAGNEAQIAEFLSQFIINNQLDGIDIDWEDTAAFQGVAGYDGIDFLVKLTKELRVRLPSPRYLISHAPQPPYLETNSSLGGYVEVVKQVGDLIDRLNIQFYNNLPWSANCGLIVSSYQNFAQLEGLSAEKLLVGLPVTQSDAGTGYIPVEKIVSDIIKPLQNQGDFGGMMNWQFASNQEGEWANIVGKALGLTAPGILGWVMP